MKNDKFVRTPLEFLMLSLSGCEIRVLLTILYHQRGDKPAWPKTEKISELTGISDGTIRNCYSSLKKKGLLKRKRGHKYWESTVIIPRHESITSSIGDVKRHESVTNNVINLVTSNRLIEKINEETTIPPLPPKVKEVPTAAVPAVKDEENSLYHSVKDAFLSKVGTFTSWPKEGAAIKGLILKAKARSPDDPGGFLKELIGAYYKIRKEDKFFGKQPFLPSALNAAGIFDRVMVSFETEKDEIPEEIRHLYEGVKI